MSKLRNIISSKPSNDPQENGELKTKVMSFQQDLYVFAFWYVKSSVLIPKNYHNLQRH